jgi:hypothetical protein
MATLLPALDVTGFNWKQVLICSFLSFVFVVYLFLTKLNEVVEGCDWLFIAWLGRVQEMMKIVVNALEIVGVHYTMQFSPNLSKFAHTERMLVVTLGMLMASSSSSRRVALFLPSP